MAKIVVMAERGEGRAQKLMTFHRVSILLLFALCVGCDKDLVVESSDVRQSEEDNLEWAHLDYGEIDLGTKSDSPMFQFRLEDGTATVNRIPVGPSERSKNISEHRRMHRREIAVGELLSVLEQLRDLEGIGTYKNEKADFLPSLACTSTMRLCSVMRILREGGGCLTRFLRAMVVLNLLCGVSKCSL